jgi:hypothetical protein
MQVQYYLDKKQLDKVNATLTITMPIGDWTALVDRIDDAWPGWDMKRHILDCCDKAKKTFYGENP